MTHTAERPLQTNRGSVPMGYQYEYLQALAAKLGITDTSQALSVIVLDHIRCIGLEGAPVAGESQPASFHSAKPVQPPAAGENLLEGFLPPSMQGASALAF